MEKTHHTCNIPCFFSNRLHICNRVRLACPYVTRACASIIYIARILGPIGRGVRTTDPTNHSKILDPPSLVLHCLTSVLPRQTPSDPHLRRASESAPDHERASRRRIFRGCGGNAPFQPFYGTFSLKTTSDTISPAKFLKTPANRL